MATHGARWHATVLGLSVLTLVVVSGCGADPAPAARSAPAPSASASAARPLVPDFRTGEYAALYRTLDAQAKGLLDGDKAAWLAPVDPKNTKIQAKYRKLYANLRGLGVTQWSHQSVLPPRPTDLGFDGMISVVLNIVYCFKGEPCKPWDLTATGDDAAESWSVTYVMTERDGKWILLDDHTFGLQMRHDPSWVPGGPKYEADLRG